MSTLWRIYICKSSYYQHKQLCYCETEQWKTEEISKDFKFSPGDPSKLWIIQPAIIQSYNLVVFIHLGTSYALNRDETTDNIDTYCHISPNDSDEPLSDEDIHSEPGDDQNRLYDEDDIRSEPEVINNPDRQCDEVNFKGLITQFMHSFSFHSVCPISNLFFCMYNLTHKHSLYLI